MNLYSVVKPLGILTYILLLLTIISGWKKWGIKKHTRIAIITIIAASVHALMVILF